MTYVEAMQFERPQVVCDLDFVHEVCGDAALYVPPDSAARLAEAMRCLAENQALRADLIERGRTRVRTQFVSPAEHTRLLLESVAGGVHRAMTTTGPPR
jgi:glycosyltransferase involved in cell wall biosynthesis